VWEQSVFRAGFFGNPMLIGAVALTVVLQFVVIYFGPLAAVFKTVPLEWWQVLLCAGIASSVFFIVELEKGIRRKRPMRPAATVKAAGTRGAEA